MQRFLLGLMLLVAPVALIHPAAAQTPGRAAATDITNIAAAANGGRVLSVTSTLDNDKAYSGDNLIDGQIWTPNNPKSSKGWASDRYDPIAMDAITLGFAGNRLYKIGKLVISPGTDLPVERWAKDVEVQVSTDTAEGPYSTVSLLTLKADPKPQSFDILPTQARFVRLVIRSNFGSDRAVALGEVEIYEAIDDTDPLGSLIGRLESAVNELSNYRQFEIDGTNSTQKVSAQQPALSPATIQTIQLLGDGDDRVPLSKTNIAAAKNGGKIMAYSSIYNNDPQYGPDKLIDSQNWVEAEGKGSFGWASQGFKPGEEFVTLGFGDDRSHLIGKIVLNPASNQSDLRWARRIDVQATSDSYKDGPWKTVATINMKHEPVNQDYPIRPVEAKYLRFVFRANGPGVDLPNADPNVNSDRAVSLGEIEVYDAVAGGDQLKTLIGRFTSILTDLKALRRRMIQPDGTVNADAIKTTKPATKPKVAPVKNPKPAPQRRGELEAESHGHPGMVG